jgi:hypothetical protein
MTLSAWVFMLLVWGVILGMTGFCFWKLLFQEHLAEAPLFDGQDDATSPERP